MKKLIRRGLGLCLVVAMMMQPMTGVITADAIGLFAKDDAEDPMYGGSRGEDASGLEEGEIQDYGITTTSSFTGGYYAHDSRFDGYTIRNGIDVSKYQGDINWTAVRASGIEFAFVRVGYRKKLTGEIVADEKAAANLSAAAAAGPNLR